MLNLDISDVTHCDAPVGGSFTIFHHALPKALSGFTMVLFVKCNSEVYLEDGCR